MLPLFYNRDAEFLKFFFFRIRQSREDIATGRFHADGVDAHKKAGAKLFPFQVRALVGAGGRRCAGGQLRVFFLFSCAKLRVDYFFFV